MFVRDEGAWTSGPDEALVAAARADAERTLRITGEPLLVRASRWEHAMPRYTVGHLRRVAAVEAAVGAWPAVTVAGASYRGVGLPDCVTQGLAAAASVAARLRAGTADAGSDARRWTRAWSGRSHSPDRRLPTMPSRPDRRHGARSLAQGGPQLRQPVHRLDVEGRPEDQDRVGEARVPIGASVAGDLLDRAAGR